MLDLLLNKGLDYLYAEEWSVEGHVLLKANAV